MRIAGRRWIIAAAAAAVLAACKTQEVAPPPKAAPKPPPAPAATARAPAACTAELPKRHRLYTLPPTIAPIAKEGKDKSAPLQWAIALPVGKPLTEIGTWHVVGDGWSSIGLRLASENASGMSVHLSKVNIAEAAQIWLCSPDGHTKRGPLQPGADGELATAVVPGSEVWLEVLSPTRNVPRTTVTLVEVYGGFR